MLVPVRVHLVTFIIVLPLFCFILHLDRSLYYQLITTLSGLLRSDLTFHMDTELLGDMFVENNERLAVVDQFLALQQPIAVGKNVSAYEKFRTEIDTSLAYEIPLQHFNKNASITVAVLIISAGRETVISNDQRFAPRYLTQNVARFLALMHKQKHSNTVSYKLLICSIGGDITDEEQSLGSIVQLVRNPHADSASTFGPFHDRLAWRYEKEKRDYAFCLLQAIHHGEFVVIVEDDALPMDASLAVISRLVAGHWTSRPGSHTVGHQFYVKLYHPVHLQGYISTETERLPQLLAVGVVLGSCFYLGIIWLASVIKNDKKLTIQHKTWIHCCIYCGLIALCIGRVHMDCWHKLFSPYTHYLVSDKFCCTQAILYTAQAARDLAVYLDSTHCNDTYHKDNALWDFPTPGYLMQPNVFEHVGVWSSVRQGFVDPHSIS